MVEVDEGQVGYWGPSFGGFVALADLVEVRLTEFHGTRQWRLRTASGEVLTVPVDAAGAEKLYDAFAALPGIDMAALRVLPAGLFATLTALAPATAAIAGVAILGQHLSPLSWAGLVVVVAAAGMALRESAVTA